MSDPQQAPIADGVTPDVGFSLTDPYRPESSAVAAERSEDTAGQASEREVEVADLIHRIGRELAAAAPEGWIRLAADFSLTVAGGLTQVLYHDEADRIFRAEAPPHVFELVRQHREMAAALGAGPWWRMMLDLDNTGESTIEYDYGQEPFPDDQLQSPEAYLADLQAFPRDRMPVWLAAYILHDDRQVRPAGEAAAAARIDREANIAPIRSEGDFPELPVLWARWATIAAAFVAVRSELGPRIMPALGVFEGASRSGSTLYLLPGGRAVLSGGVWNAPELDDAYNDGTPLPDVYSGAPQWVADPVLNPRSAVGLLSFCYWWDHHAWYRGDSPAADHVRAAVPGVWSAQDVVDILCGVVSIGPTEEVAVAAANLVAAAEAGAVSRHTVIALFDNPLDDIDGALYQLSMAGLLEEIESLKV
jgi:hypothetical protein